MPSVLRSFPPDDVGYFSLCGPTPLCTYVYDSVSFILLGLFVPSSILWVSRGLLHVYASPVMDTDLVITFLFHKFVWLERWGTLD